MAPALLLVASGAGGIMKRSTGRAVTFIVLLAAAAAAGAFILIRDDGAGGPDAGGITPTAATTPGPCAYASIDPAVYGERPFVNPTEISSNNGRLDTTLTVKLTNPSTTKIAGCGVELRSYNGALVGPTLRVKPGDTLGLDLRNGLAAESLAQQKQEFHQEADVSFIVHRPADFNTTLVHFHGLHVSPRGHGDNVLHDIPPQSSYQYEVELPGGGPGQPAAHTPGTYWYHAHAHGSTAIQVGSAMAGALIVEDDPDKIPPELAAASENENVMLFQSIPYDTTGHVENMVSFFPPQNGDAGCSQGLPACSWQGSMRRTTINGQIVPVIKMRPGEVRRWRMIDGTFNESLHLRLQGHDLHEIALDGLYLGRVDTWDYDQGQYVDLEPGYRSDVLVQASSTPGTYNLVDAPVDKNGSLRGVPEDGNLVAQVVVSGDPVDMKLPTDAEMAPLAAYRGVDLTKAPNLGIQTVSFNISKPANGFPKKFYFQVNGAAFSPDHVRRVFLNDVDEWQISTTADIPHVFHIHVNPFQVMREGPDGDDELVWKDTLLVQGDPVNIWTQYLDYTGKFVMHCHILDHEDLGMMEVVDVIKPSDIEPGSGHNH